MLIPFHGLPPQKTAIAIFQEYSIVEQIKPPKTKTLKQKIKEDINGCEPKYYISAEDASCLPKPVYTQPKAKTRSKPIKNTSGNAYPFSQCTWLAKQLTPWASNSWGNANRWDDNARRDGFTVSNIPVVGAIAQTDRGAYGHLGVVLAVNSNGTITMREKNYDYRGSVRTRTARISEFKYIYP